MKAVKNVRIAHLAMNAVKKEYTAKKRDSYYNLPLQISSCCENFFAVKFCKIFGFKWKNYF